MSFHVGQLVVCVDDRPQPANFLGMHGIARGVVYTIRGLTTQAFECVYLLEILRPAHPKGSVWEGDEMGYGSFRFRPVDEKRIEVFRKIAASPRQPIEVDA